MGKRAQGMTTTTTWKPTPKTRRQSTRVLSTCGGRLGSAACRDAFRTTAAHDRGVAAGVHSPLCSAMIALGLGCLAAAETAVMAVMATMLAATPRATTIPVMVL